MNYQTIGLISGGVSLFAYGLYIYGIWRGNTRPSRSSWWILSLTWVIVLLSSISLAPGNTFNEQWEAIASRWLSVSYILGSLIIAISSIWRGSKEKWELFDYLCAIFAGISILLYFIFKNPAASLVFGILADFFGLMPTVKHSWSNPEEENLIAWCIESLAGILGVLAVTHWTLSFTGASDWASPIYLANMNILIVILIRRKYLFRKLFKI